MAQNEEDNYMAESKLCSVCGQNIIVIEIHPDDMNGMCPGLNTEYAKCRLSHLKSDPYRQRQGVLICNVGHRLLYIAYALDINVHEVIST
eukprot:13812500-Ditylum_brightwellii.AAC.1